MACAGNLYMSAEKTSEFLKSIGLVDEAEKCKVGSFNFNHSILFDKYGEVIGKEATTRLEGPYGIRIPLSLNDKKANESTICIMNEAVAEMIKGLEGTLERL